MSERVKCLVCGRDIELRYEWGRLEWYHSASDLLPSKSCDMMSMDNIKVNMSRLATPPELPLEYYKKAIERIEKQPKNPCDAQIQAVGHKLKQISFCRLENGHSGPDKFEVTIPILPEEIKHSHKTILIYAGNGFKGEL